MITETDCTFEDEKGELNRRQTTYDGQGIKRTNQKAGMKALAVFLISAKCQLIEKPQAVRNGKTRLLVLKGRRGDPAVSFDNQVVRYAPNPWLKNTTGTINNGPSVLRSHIHPENSHPKNTTDEVEIYLIKPFEIVIMRDADGEVIEDVEELKRLADGFTKELKPRSDANGDEWAVASKVPRPEFEAFIDPAPLERLKELLRKKAPAVINITGAAGIGKTSLAVGMANEIAWAEAEVWPFRGVFWIEASQNPSALSVTLESVLNQVIDGLESPNSQLKQDSARLRKLEMLLRQKPIAIFIDGYDRVEDPQLHRWLASLPDISKAVLIDPKHDFGRAALPLKLRPLTESQAERLYDEELGRCTECSPEAWTEAVKKHILDVARGNPGAMIAAFRAFDGGAPLSEIRQEKLWLGAFNRTWERLEDSAKETLSAVMMFPYGASEAVLGSVLGRSGEAVRADFYKLTSLIEKVQEEGQQQQTRYVLNHIAEPFLPIASQKNKTVEADLRKAWLRYAVAFVKPIGDCWDALERLRVLDDEIDRKNIQAAIRWAAANGHYKEAIEIAQQVRYYFYIRNNWADSESPAWIAAEAAQAIGDILTEFDNRVYHVNERSKVGDTRGAERAFKRIGVLIKHKGLGFLEHVRNRHAMALYHQAKGDSGSALRLWKQNLADPSKLPPKDLSPNLRWYSRLLIETNKFEKADELLQQHLNNPKLKQYERPALSAGLAMAQLYLRKSEAIEAKKALLLLDQRIADLANPAMSAEFEWLSFLCEKERGRIEEAKGHLERAVEFYRQLSCRASLLRAEREMAELLRS